MKKNSRIWQLQIYLTQALLNNSLQEKTTSQRSQQDMPVDTEEATSLHGSGFSQDETKTGLLAIILPHAILQSSSSNQSSQTNDYKLQRLHLDPHRFQTD